MKVKLKDCPSGCTPYLTKWNNIQGNLSCPVGQVRCNHGWSGPERFGSNCEEAAIRAWNSRHEDAKQPSPNRICDNCGRTDCMCVDAKQPAQGWQEGAIYQFQKGKLVPVADGINGSCTFTDEGQPARGLVALDFIKLLKLFEQNPKMPYVPMCRLICARFGKPEGKELELRDQLEAWQKVFGTSQLSHAQARLEAAESAHPAPRVPTEDKQ